MRNGKQISQRSECFDQPRCVCKCGQTLLSVFDVYFLETCEDCLREEIRENPELGWALSKAVKPPSWDVLF